MKATTFSTIALVASATFCTTSSANADQLAHIGANFNKTYGNPSIAAGYFTAGADAYVWGNSSGDRSTKAIAYVDAGVTVFNFNVSALDFEVYGSCWVAPEGNHAEAHGHLRIGPYSVFNQTSTASIGVSHEFGPYSVLGGGVEATFWVGPVPITVGIDAGVGAEIGVNVGADVAEHAMYVTPNARGFIYGSASAGVGAFGFSAGVSATLNLADTTLGYTLTADTEDGLSGSFGLDMLPLAIDISLYASVAIWPWYETWTLPIYDYYADPISISSIQLD